MKADSDKIKELLDSNVSQYRIWKDTGISQSKISDLRSGKSEISKISLANASLLTEYAEKIL